MKATKKRARVRLQSAARGMLARRDAQRSRVAVRLQSAARGMLARCDAQQQRLAAARLQSIVVKAINAIESSIISTLPLNAVVSSESQIGLAVGVVDASRADSACAGWCKLFEQSCPYETLGISKDAHLTSAIKHDALRKAHPDRGGDSNAFHRVKRVVDLLSNPRLRKLYDAHGWAGAYAEWNGREPSFESAAPSQDSLDDPRILVAFPDGRVWAVRPEALERAPDRLGVASTSRLAASVQDAPLSWPLTVRRADEVRAARSLQASVAHPRPLSRPPLTHSSAFTGAVAHALADVQGPDLCQGFVRSYEHSRWSVLHSDGRTSDANDRRQAR